MRAAHREPRPPCLAPLCCCPSTENTTPILICVNVPGQSTFPLGLFEQTGKNRGILPRYVRFVTARRRQGIFGDSAFPLVRSLKIFSGRPLRA